MITHDIQANTATVAILEHGRRVIRAEIDALIQLEQQVDESFSAAVMLLQQTRGRIVVTGMGKSGHVARKIAATFAATGSPAIFLHPAEAAHGDLGMVQHGDTLVVLSNSGSTPELSPVMQHCRSLRIRIIGMASRLDSPVMQAADVRLLLPQVREACPSNIAPTSSTAVMLALGDALAMALSELRGADRESLKALHPGGAIGLRLMAVSEMMHSGPSVPLVSRDTPMRDVIMIMTSMGFGAAGVLDGEGRLIGVITDGDLRRHVGDLGDGVAADVMTANPKTVPPDTLAEDALMIMNDCKITTVFVMEAERPERPAGIVHIHDFVRYGLS
ncbi:MAG: KpsF/GutQ family sugar-phosphate isomerase [Pseudomonadota bacterium]|uniref:KpsF/GutQ family sugar-phosphate isomerase n=1 Tax=Rhizorhabdus phycosphaerae TaxID=2711156 RepID=UPI0013ECFBE5|nr:KpsF/GutQ family sugar-phosphate isomerase [Rhizorhabdus phycosphaerae]